jgi:predicted transporter
VVGLDAVALVRLVAEKVNVSLPMRPVIVKPEKVATPLAKEAVAFVSVPVPVDTDAVTVPVALVTGLPLASSAVTTGCVVRATPLEALVLGCVVITN